MASQETPLMRQYNEIKSRHKDSLLLFRMGDFYELFFEDALKAAKALDIALTSRNKNDPDPVPMCGVPHHSAAGYINRLVSQGFKVAICEQLEDPAVAKGIVKRDVIRVVSPGTRLDPESLEAKAPNFTHAAQPFENGTVAWATIDFTTGKFWFGTVKGTDEWLAIAAAQAPAETLFPDTPAGERLLLSWREASPRTFAQTVPAFYFEAEYASERLREQFGVTSLNAVHPTLTAMPGPCGALIKYFQETQKASRIPSAIRAELWGSDAAMELDAATVAALELMPRRSGALTGKDVSLLSFLDRTKTAMGGRLLREWLVRPLTDRAAIEARLQEVEALREGFEPLLAPLAEIYDLERLLSRVSLGTGAMAGARELLALACSIERSVELSRLVPQAGLRAQLEQALKPDVVAAARETTSSLVEKPPATTREGGMFRKGFSAQLDELIELSENGEQWLASFEAREREATGIGSLKVRFNRVFGYYIEITKANLASAPKHYIRKQTMVGGERFIAEELKHFEEKILTADKKRCDLEHALFRELCGRFAALSATVMGVARAVARVDVIASLAAIAREDGYVRPQLDDSADLEIIEGRHPTVAAAMARARGAFVPNTVKLTSRERFLIITGPNMGGKSTVMRQTALITLLAQIGSFVPAKRARIGIVDQIFTRIGASDNIAEGASTFMVEMSEMSYILRHATARSLILIDEIGRGTSTYDGMSLAWALAAEICQRIQARTMFATHYHELTQLAGQYDGATNARVAVAHDEHTIRFLYKLEPGAASRSYGILVARLAGLPEEVLLTAESMLTQLESQSRKPKVPGEKNQLSLRLDRPRSAPVAAPAPAPVHQPPSAVETWLSKLELDSLTPIQALSQLAQMKEKLGAKSPQC